MNPELPSPSVAPATMKELKKLSDVAKFTLGAPHEVLTHEARGPYLEKWRLSQDADGSARMLHRFLRSDGDEEFHDHPWDNRTLMISGGYWDVTPTSRQWVAPGEILIRKAHDFHRIELEDGVIPMTIFWHGPKINEWGFLGVDGIKIPADKFLADSGMYRMQR